MKTARPRKRVAEAVYERRGWWLTIGLEVSRRQTDSNRYANALNPGAGLTFRRYLQVLDVTARLIQGGKQRLTSDTRKITVRLTATPTRIAAEVQHGSNTASSGRDWGQFSNLREIASWHLR